VKSGDVVLTWLFQRDGSQKPRPAIILKVMPPFGDYLVCGFSSQIRHQVPNLDEIIAPEDSDFVSSGLLHTSLIRLGWLFTIPSQSIEGIVGSIDNSRLDRLLKSLSTFLAN
jgi:mRNA interferase MazF